LAPGAGACSFCGVPALEETVHCPACGTENNLQESVCGRCGQPLFREAKSSGDFEDLFGQERRQAVAREWMDRFLLAFERRLAEEVHPSRHADYSERLRHSPFYRQAELRLGQLAEMNLDAAPPDSDRNRVMQVAFEDLLDFFIVLHCRDLNEVTFQETILRWQGLPLEDIRLADMVADHLDFGAEFDRVYTEFVSMPPDKLKNAASAFLFPQKKETIFFISNLSLLGNFREGYAMTDQCLYWKMPMEKSQRVYYRNLEEIRRQAGGWITVNGIFFDAGTGINLKMIRLLKRLRLLFQRK
jgi:hypothetical protein